MTGDVSPVPPDLPPQPRRCRHQPVRGWTVLHDHQHGAPSYGGCRYEPTLTTALTIRLGRLRARLRRHT